MDAVDITQARLEAEDELKRKRQEQEAAKPKAVFRECQECGDEMPAVRQAYGFRLCVERGRTEVLHRGRACGRTRS